MKQRRSADLDIPPRAPSDWIGAWVLQAGERRAPPIPGGFEFHIFRASTNPALFAITDRRNPAVLPNCPGGGEWRLFKVVPETGQRRVGFSEAEAKSDIKRMGFHLAMLDAEQRKSQRRGRVEKRRYAGGA